MKFHIIVFITTIQFIINVTAVTVKTEPSISPDYPDKCWFVETKTAYSPGDSFTPPNTCTRYICQSDFSFEQQMCDELKFPIQCFQSDENLAKPYPKCCPKMICPPMNKPFSGVF